MDIKILNKFYSKYKSYNKDELNEGEFFYEWSNLKREIKDFIERVTIKKIKNNEKYKIDFSLFKDIFDDIELNELIKEYNYNIYESELYLKEIKSNNKWIIDFPYKLIYEYLKKQADSICEIINDILSKENIKIIIFVGSYCNNEVLLDLIKKGLNNNLIYVEPLRPCFYKMEGPVIFGIGPKYY